jgi:hypothetical protein
MLAHTSQLDISTLYKNKLDFGTQFSVRYCSGAPSYAALPYPSIPKNTQISVVAKMTTNVICLVNGTPKKPPLDPRNYRSAVLYYENVKLEAFKFGGFPSGRRCEVKPKVGQSPGRIDWEGQIWGTSVCNTIRSPLWAILLCVDVMGHGS